MRPYATLLAGALIASTAPILFALADVPAALGALYRFLYSLGPLILLGLLHPQIRASLLRRGWHRAALVAGLFFGIDMAVWHHAIHLVGAGPATLLANTQVIWVALYGIVLLKERAAPAFWLALPVCFGGMFLVTGGATGFAEARSLEGLVAGFFAGFVYAIALIALRRAGRTQSPHVMAIVLVSVMASTATVFGISAAQGLLTVELTAKQHMWLAILGVGVQLIAWNLITSGLRDLPGHHGAALLLVQPVATLVWGYWVLDQALGGARLLGAALVLAGVALATLERPAKS